MIAIAFLCSSFAFAQRAHEDIPWESMFRKQGQISLRADPGAFSPNDDGRQDSAFFFLGTQGVPELSKWAIVIENSRGRTVRRFSGRGSPPGLTEWNGTNGKNAPLPEGVYAAKATIWGPGGKISSAKIKATLDKTPPRLNITLSTPTFSPGEPAGGVTMALRADDNNAAARWALSIFVKGHPDVEVFSASGVFAGGLAAQPWNGLDSRTQQAVPHGLYSVRATIQDAAGNETAAPDLEVEAVVLPESILKQLSQTIDVETTAGGLRLAVPCARIFNNKYSADFSDESSTLRQRLLYLIQSYPDHNIFLEGRVGSEKSAEERTELSSIQAWSIYSFLVKSGVAATRLNVKGSGGARGENNQIILRFELPSRQGPETGRPDQLPAKTESKTAVIISSGSSSVPSE